MVIRKCTPERVIDQCRIASFVKGPDCCNSQNPSCTNSGCQESQISDIFHHFGIAFQARGQIDLNQLTTEIGATPGRLVEILVRWNTGENSAHTLLVAGVRGTRVFLIDPLGAGDSYYGGWQDFAFVQHGFGQGAWVRSWVGLTRGV
jgi:hypothetical protein